MTINTLEPIIQATPFFQGLEERHIDLQLTDAVRDYLASEGYDPQFGARPLKRVIQKEVENRIARALLDGTISDGAHVTLDIRNGKPALALS